jgi:predicted PurR-regulated permease PerM
MPPPEGYHATTVKDDMRDTGSTDGSTTTPAGELPQRHGLPQWFRTVGEGAWLLVGMALLAAIALLLLGLISDLVIPLIFAAILAAIFVPLVDVLERWRIPRWLGAVVVVLIAIALVAFVAWIVVAGLVSREPSITREATAGLQAVPVADLTESDAEQLTQVAADVARLVVGGVLSGLGSVTVLIVGMVTGVFILLFLMKDWRLIIDGTAERISSVLRLEPPVGHEIVSNVIHTFRSYTWGLTIVGAMNAVVVGFGALALGVPLAGPIAIVTFVTSYIPFFGAFLSGAFAVVIAFSAQSLGTALAMLAIVLLSNNTLQNLLEPVAFGRALRLHPLTVMLVTTAGTLLFGVLGATLAAPVTAVTIRTVSILGDAGLLSAGGRRLPTRRQVLGG